MAKCFTLQEERMVLMRMGLPYSIYQKVLQELRKRGGYSISPAELRSTTQKMMRDKKDGITSQQAWRIRRKLKELENK